MTLLVVSDTHGRGYERLRSIIERNKGFDSLLFLGDGIRDLDTLPSGSYGVLSVLGNCDCFSKYSLLGESDALLPPEELLVDFDGVKIFMTHGHKLSVKGGIDRAVEYAARKGADILLFGHTHTPLEQYIPEGEIVGGYKLTKPLWVFNPGSLGEPRGSLASFGVIEIRKGSVLLSHGTV